MLEVNLVELFVDIISTSWVISRLFSLRFVFNPCWYHSFVLFLNVPTSSKVAHYPKRFPNQIPLKDQTTYYRMLPLIIVPCSQVSQETWAGT